MTKVIFLDIDGVLNSNFWNETHQREISDGTLIDEEKVKLLAPLVKRTSAKIILHSGWRFWFDSELKPLETEAESLVELFAKADEILLWLKLHDDVTGWVVLDDLDLHNCQVEQHQVKTDQRIGLTVDDVKLAEKILMDKI